ncbi:hypothetical protein [Salidesulfovibrio onnuriiensis]|uniref:hypothetical protein n=1 Tax=Salidesulfovibrio onnuriiensis TaxID=2583823 RepID=UPI0011CB8851|nr:hypothetical protein [Salidesulfovibrio onnuriiensis]
MLIRDKKHFFMGLGLLAAFFCVLAFMFTPSFGGINAFRASDNMFNSISKGSTYYIPEVMREARQFKGQQFDVKIFTDKPALTLAGMRLLTINGFNLEPSGAGIHVRGDMGRLMGAALRDADTMFKNDGDAMKRRYGMAPKKAMYAWWMLLKDVKLALDQQKNFKPATFIDKRIIARGVEVGYNYFGIEGRKAVDEWGMITFALIFYVVYTMWFGYSIFFLFEGLGLQMTASKKKEM